MVLVLLGWLHDCALCPDITTLLCMSGGVYTSDVVQGIENYEREKALYDGIVMEYLELEDIVRNQSNPGGPYSSTLHRALPPFLGYPEWWWKCLLRGPVLRCVPSLLLSTAFLSFCPSAVMHVLKGSALQSGSASLRALDVEQILSMPTHTSAFGPSFCCPACAEVISPSDWIPVGIKTTYLSLGCSLTLQRSVEHQHARMRNQSISWHLIHIVLLAARQLLHDFGHELRVRLC